MTERSPWRGLLDAGWFVSPPPAPPPPPPGGEVAEEPPGGGGAVETSGTEVSSQEHCIAMLSYY